MSLVRFRCFLQDTTPPPEIFLPLLDVTPPSIAALEASDEQCVDYSKLAERNVSFAISIPGEGHWVEHALYGETHGDESNGIGDDVALSGREQWQKAFEKRFVKVGKQTERKEIGAWIKVYNSEDGVAEGTDLKVMGIYTFVGLLTME